MGSVAQAEVWALSGRARSLRPSATVAVTSRALELQRQGVDLISLSVGEPDFDTPAHIRDAAIRAMLPIAGEQGWNWATIRAGLAAVGEDPVLAESHFPTGATGAVAAWIDLANREMIAAAAAGAAESGARILLVSAMQHQIGTATLGRAMAVFYTVHRAAHGVGLVTVAFLVTALPVAQALAIGVGLDLLMIAAGVITLRLWQHRVAAAVGGG